MLKGVVSEIAEDQRWDFIGRDRLVLRGGKPLEG